MGARTTKRLCDTYDREAFKRIRDKVASSGIEPNFNENAISVLKMRYLQKDAQGKIVESAKDLVARVSAYVALGHLPYMRDGKDATNSKDYSRYSAITPEEEKALIEIGLGYHNFMASSDFMPNSPTLMNAGKDNTRGMLSACFVLPVEDSVEEIFDAVKNAALIQQAGGGTGFAFDRLRPRGARVKSSGGTTSGPITFMRVFAEGTAAIQQGAFRRGANMGMMSIEHPNILEFLYAKSPEGQYGQKGFENFNLSVKITDEWMEDLKRDRNSLHISTDKKTGKRYYISKTADKAKCDLSTLIPVTGEKPAVEVYTKGDLFDLIVANACRGGEPGILFIDRVNRDNPFPKTPIEATNPCGEQPLLPFESCNLGSINLGRYVVEKGGKREVDFERLAKSARLGTRFLEDVLEMNSFPLEEIDKISRANRKIGLGVMGFADMLFQLGIRYGSQESYELGERIMGILNIEGGKESEKLAEERGAFPSFAESTFAGKTPRRNSAITTVAPTGTISIIVNASGGLEPFFDLVSTHQDAEGNKRLRVNPYFERELRARVKDDKVSDEILAQLAEGKSLREIEKAPDELKRFGVIAHDLAPEEHIMMQAAFQRNTDASISKTINYSNKATEEDVKKGVLMAHESGCKGVTVYRDKSIVDQPLTRGDTRDKPGELEQKTGGSVSNTPVVPKGGWHSKLFPEDYVLSLVDVPDMMPAIKIKQRTPYGNMHVEISVDPVTGREYEVFASISKGGEVVAADLEGTCRVISSYLRLGGDGAEIVKQLRGIGANIPSVPLREGTISSLPDALGRAIEKFRLARNTLGIKALLSGEFEEEFIDKLYDTMKNGKAIVEDSEKKSVLTEEEMNGRKEQIKKYVRTGYEEHCEQCGRGKLLPIQGCKICDTCGFEKCGGG